MNHRADLLLIILALAVVLFIALNQPARAATPMTNRSQLVFRPVTVPALVDRLPGPSPTRSAVLGITTELQSERRPVSGQTTRRSLALSGVASWYRGTYSSGERTLYAAVGSWRWGDTPYRVTVTAGDRSVTVVVRDHCHACEDGRPLIDLSPAAFAALAPLSRGIVRVTLYGGNPDD